MNNYDKNKESSYLVYFDANNLYGYAMSKKLPIRNFKCLDKDDLSKFNDELIKKYDENSEIGHIFEVDKEYPKHSRMLHGDLPFLPERMKINKSTKLFCNVQDKKNYVVHIVALNQALDHGFKITKVHEIIQFDQEVWLKPYIDMNTRLRTEAKNDFEKDYFKLKIDAFYGKTKGNPRNHRDIRIVTSGKKRSILASEPNYHSTKYISEDLLIMEMKKTEVKMNKPLYLGHSILDISKTLMYEFWYVYIKPKYGDFTIILLMMLKDCLIHLIMIKKITDLF